MIGLGALQAIADDRTQYPAQERQLRQKRYTMRLDSLISSDEFQFVPISMSWQPGGGLQTLSNNYPYYVGVFKTQLQVHLPIVVGRAIGCNAMATFDTDTLYDRQSVKTDSGWETSFSVKDQNGTVYRFTFTIYNVTGHVILDLLTAQNAIRYLGYVEPNETLAGVP